MSHRLKRRVAKMGSNQAQAAAGFSPVTGGAASPPAVDVMPLAQVMVYPDPAGAAYSSVAYRGLSPIFTSGSMGGGAAVPATSPGRWGQLVAAGRP